MIRLRSHTAQAYIEAISRMGGLVEEHPRWRHAEIPRQMGKGTWEYYHLQKGLELTISRYHFEQTVHVDFVNEHPMFCFGCLLDGGFDLRARFPKYATTLVRGQGMNMWTSEGEYFFRLSAGSYVGVQLVVDPEILLEKVAAAGLLPPDLRRAAMRSAFPVQICTNALSAVAYEASNRALSLSSEDPFRMLQLESLALIILREQLHSLWTSIPRSSLSRRDLDRVLAVRDFLLHHPEQSPGLAELANMVGMNEFNLTRGFRLQFGQSIYEFLRRHRLEIADQLLAEGEHSVAEVAKAIGYRSHGRFSAAFRRQFGVTPKRHQLALRYRKSKLSEDHLQN